MAWTKQDLAHGPVEITSGKHRGKIAFYDDDGETEGGDAVAIVYLGEPWKSRAIRLKHRCIKNIAPAIVGSLE